MTPDTKRRVLSTTCIIGFFVAWEIICLMFHVSDLVLPRPSQVLVTLWVQFPAIWPHAVQTLHDHGRIGPRYCPWPCARHADRLVAACL